MKWLEKLENCNASFHIHILDKKDFIFITKANKQKYIVYMLDGLTQFLQIFTNSEKICMQLLQKDHVMAYHSFQGKENNCVIISAITKTKIIAIPSDEYAEAKIKDIKIETLRENILNKQNKNNAIASILSHRNTKKRIVQLLMILIKQFGEIKRNKITIPFHLSHKTIANIIGSQRITVNKIMNSLKQNHTLSYNNKSITVNNLIKLIQ